MLTLKATVLAILILTSMQSLADVHYRAGYELNLQVGSDDWSIQTMSGLSEAEPIVHHLGSYEVSIFLTDVTKTTYSIAIVVSDSSASTIQSELLRFSFEGGFNGIAEFASENTVMSVDGAIALGMLDN